MKIPLSWLQELVDIPCSPQELVERLIETGTEVESVETTGNTLDNVVIGHVLTCVEHPNSDHMHITTVDVGEAEPLQIVCGAPNIAAGQTVAVACIGAMLPGDFKIKKSRLRGVDSCGMICSAAELGLGTDHSGIMVLSDAETLAPGTPFTHYLKNTDTILTCEITPNRPDCLNLSGFAREVSAILNTDTHIVHPQIEHEAPSATSDAVAVTVEDGKRCPRYMARYFTNIEIGPSPEWMQKRLQAVGCHPINNVVDITNYVLFYLGQPLHAFDAQKISTHNGKHSIVVRKAHDGERMMTLDGDSRTLTSDMTLITDNGTKPLAIAGVMGGQDSEISDDTKEVILEIATFDPGATSRTSRNLGLITESSLRYERGVDQQTSPVAAEVAAALLERYAHATVHKGAVDVVSVPYEAPHITMRPEHVRMIIGAEVDNAFMRRSLEQLGCTLTKVGDAFEVIPPSTRPDLTRECDLIEEVLRLYGMDHVPARLPASRDTVGGLTQEQRALRKLKASLCASGLYETSTYCFAEDTDAEALQAALTNARPVHAEDAPDGPADCATAEQDQRSDANASAEAGGSAYQDEHVCQDSNVVILNPLTATQTTMRQHIFTGLLRSVAYNISHGTEDIVLFEVGRVFFTQPNSKQPREPLHVSAVYTGSLTPGSWDQQRDPVSFYDAKGAIEQVVKALHVAGKLGYKNAKHTPWLQPGRSAEIYLNKHKIGWVGDIHPLVSTRFGVTVPVVAFELEVEPLIQNISGKRSIAAVPEFPAIVEDISFVVPEETTYEVCRQRLSSAAGKYLESLTLVDVYRDEKRIGKNRKSLTFSLVFRAKDRSLTQDEVSDFMKTLRAKIDRSLGAEERV